MNVLHCRTQLMLKSKMLQVIQLGWNLLVLDQLISVGMRFLHTMIIHAQKKKNLHTYCIAP